MGEEMWEGIISHSYGWWKTSAWVLIKVAEMILLLAWEKNEISSS